ncbi:MAG: tetrahydromethanopterin S-methyltransferase subunit D [Methermicoccaceae archaeon]
MIDPYTLVAGITLGGVLVCFAVHFIPVGGAPAAMAQTTGIGTGTTMLAVGSGLTGLVSAGFMLNVVGAEIEQMPLVLASGAIGAMLMLAFTMLVGNYIYVMGVGVVPSSAKVKYDPITKDRQDLYVSQGTEGHGMPTVCFVSGLLGALFGGIGGSLVYWMLYHVSDDPAMSGIFAIGIFLVNSVIASYNIVGTIEGFHDPKFKRLPKAVVASLVVTFLCAVIAIYVVPGGAVL